MNKYIKLLRVNQYLKNMIVFVPAFFGRNILRKEIFASLLIGFTSFCLMASSIYILNDINDMEFDRKHPHKKNRPIASGDISIKKGRYIAALCVCLSWFLLIAKRMWIPLGIVVFYALLNIFYTKYLKKVAIVDLIVLSLFYVIRLIYGGR